MPSLCHLYLVLLSYFLLFLYFCSLYLSLLNGQGIHAVGVVEIHWTLGPSQPDGGAGNVSLSFIV